MLLKLQMRKILYFGEEIKNQKLLLVLKIERI